MKETLHLDQWTAKKIGTEVLTQGKLEEYQLSKLISIVQYGRENSKFYGEKLGNKTIETIDDFRWLPFTRPDELSAQGRDMLCVAEKEISRIVTLETGGSSGIPKKIYFTEEDQEHTVDYFHHGMRNLLDEDDKLLVLMPYKSTGSVGDLLVRGVERLGAEVYCLGLIGENLSYNTVLDTIYSKGISSIVALPTQAYDLMKNSAHLSLSSILLSGDYVPPQLTKDLSEAWGCKVFEHYGMTEMGYGCAVSCQQLKGYHIREADLYIEILDISNGEILPDGKWGEIVFTSLNQGAMPFIRYRTGDKGRILAEPCKCGSMLRRLDRVKSRNIKKGWS